MRKEITKKQRFNVLCRDEFTCNYCGRVAPEIALEVDHIVSLKDGGENDLYNLVAACFECNSGKGSKSIAGFKQRIEKRTKEYLENQDREQVLDKIKNIKTESLVTNYIKWSREQKMNKKLICELCGTQKKRTKDLVCHHIIPIKKDGTNVELLMSVENILVICQECNELMQGKPVFNRMSGIENKLYNFSKLEPHYNREQAKRISKQYKL